VPLAARLELWFQQHGAAAHSDRSHAVMVWDISREMVIESWLQGHLGGQI
jgi:hypothetical protein